MAKARIFQDAKEKVRRGAKACPWSVEWYDNGKRRSRSIGTRGQAKDFAAIKQAELVQRRSGLTVEKTWDEFLTAYETNVVAAMRSERSKIETRRMLKLFGSVMRPRYVSGINKLTLDEFKAKRLGHASFATTERYIKYAEQQQQSGYDAFLPAVPRPLTATA